VPIIGLTATPWTKGLGKHFEKLIIGATTQQLINTGDLSPFRAFAPASPDLTDVRTLAGDFHEGEPRQGDEQDRPWWRRGDPPGSSTPKGRPTLCFAVDRAHAKNLQQKFLEEDVPAEYIDCYTEANERNAIAKRFHAGEVKVVCKRRLLDHRQSNWDVRCIILARTDQIRNLVRANGGPRLAHR